MQLGSEACQKAGSPPGQNPSAPWESLLGASGNPEAFLQPCLLLQALSPGGAGGTGWLCAPASCSFRAPGSQEGVWGPSRIPGEQAPGLQHKRPWWLVQVRLWRGCPTRVEKLPGGSWAAVGGEPALLLPPRRAALPFFWLRWSWGALSEPLTRLPGGHLAAAKALGRGHKLLPKRGPPFCVWGGGFPEGGTIIWEASCRGATQPLLLWLLCWAASWASGIRALCPLQALGGGSWGPGLLSWPVVAPPPPGSVGPVPPAFPQQRPCLFPGPILSFVSFAM